METAVAASKPVSYTHLASKQDFELVKDIGLRETGIPVSYTHLNNREFIA